MLFISLLACSPADPGLDSGGKQDSTPSANIPGLVINEFLASNLTINTDAAQEYDDWVEIYNPTSTIVQFDGFYLTDDEAEPTKYALPAGRGINAQGFQLIWCDDDIDQGDDHAAFKLDKAGGYLGLYYVAEGEDAVRIDALEYAGQTEDVASARVPDGSSEWTQQTPTPGASNG